MLIDPTEVVVGMQQYQHSSSLLLSSPRLQQSSSTWIKLLWQHEE